MLNSEMVVMILAKPQCTRWAVSRRSWGSTMQVEVEISWSRIKMQHRSGSVKVLGISG